MSQNCVFKHMTNKIFQWLPPSFGDSWLPQDGGARPPFLPSNKLYLSYNDCLFQYPCYV